MRTRIVRLTVLVTAVAFAVFGIPLAVGLAKYFIDDQSAQLERLAEATATSVSSNLATPRLPAATQRDPSMQIGVYDRTGTRVGGTGPTRADPMVNAALAGVNTRSMLDGRFAVAVPVADGDLITGAVVATETTTDVVGRIALTWAFMLALGAAALISAWLLARRQARRLAAPLQDLSLAAQRLGSGDFTVHTEPTGIPEIDSVNASVNDTASRLGALVERERAFSADTSHQLRTPLAGLRLQLEAALDTPGADRSQAIRESLTSVDRLQATIEDLLMLARNNQRRAAEPLDIAVLVDDLAQRWRGTAAWRDRPLRIDVAEPAPIGYLSGAGAGQILAVLLDNAAQHGRGAVTIAFRDAPPEAMAIDVIDQGVALMDDPNQLFQRQDSSDNPDGDSDRTSVGRSGSDSDGGHSDGDNLDAGNLDARNSDAGHSDGNAASHRIGLALARRIAESEGGRLQLTNTNPTTFTLLVPATPRPASPTSPAPFPT